MPVKHPLNMLTGAVLNVTLPLQPDSMEMMSVCTTGGVLSAGLNEIFGQDSVLFYPKWADIE